MTRDKALYFRYSLYIFILFSISIAFGFYNSNSRRRPGPIGNILNQKHFSSKGKIVVHTADSTWNVTAVGLIDSPYLERLGTPKQATITLRDGGAVNGSIRLFPPYFECASHLEGFDYCWVITLLTRNSGYKTKITPMPRPGAVRQPPPLVGLFASRSPHRPNPIALSALRITSVDVEQGIINILGLDLLNGTPVLDVKPYIPAFDAFPEAAAGWMDDIDGGDFETSRQLGYQNIVSRRGIRNGRQAAAKRIKTSSSDRSGNRTTFLTNQPPSVSPADDIGNLKDDV